MFFKCLFSGCFSVDLRLRHDGCTLVGATVGDPMLRRLTFTSLLLVLLGAASVAAAQDVASLDGRLQSERGELRLAQQEFDAVRARYEEQSSAVEALKRAVLEDPVAAFALPESLREANATALELAALDARLRDEAADVEAARVALRSAVQARIEVLAASPSAAVDSAESARLVGLLAEIDADPVVYQPVPLDAILGALDDTSEELRATADELADHEARLERQLAEVGQGIERAEARERLEQRVSAFAFEERFFDDGGFRRGAVPAAASTTDRATPGQGETGSSTSNGEPTAALDPDRGVSTDDAAAEGAPESGGAEPSPPDSAGGAEAGGDFGTDSNPETDQGVGSDLGGPLDLGEVIPNTDVTVVVEPGTQSADPTLAGMGNPTEPRRGRSRSRSAELRALQEDLTRDLVLVQQQREALEREADALEARGE